MKYPQFPTHEEARCPRDGGKLGEPHECPPSSGKFSAFCQSCKVLVYYDLKC